MGGMMKMIKRCVFIIMLALGALMCAACSDGTDGGSAEVPQVDDGLITVRFKMNGGVTNALGNTADVVLRGVATGTFFLTLPDKPIPTWPTIDMTFAVWNTQRDGKGMFYYPETPVEAPEGSKELVLYAIYAEDIISDLASMVVCNDPDVIYTISDNVTFDSRATLNGTPICGLPGEAFMGKFFGNGYKISYSQSSGQVVSGLFGYLDGAVISSLEITGSPKFSLTSVDVAGGILAGTAKDSTIRNVSVNGVLAAGANNAVLGGVVGKLDNSTISGAISSAVFTGTGATMVMGGIAGYVGEGSVITDSVHQAALTLTSADTSAEHIMGAIAGINDGGIIKSSYSNSNLNIFKSNTYSGGRVHVSVFAEHGTAGGIVGDLRGGSVRDCLAFSSMINAVTAGRIAGNIEPGASVENSYARGDMLINYKGVADSDRDGQRIDPATILKSRAFFRDTLKYNFTGVWIMPDYYDFPAFLWQQDDLLEYEEITSAAGLQTISEDGRYILFNDIDLSTLNMGEANEGEWTQIANFAGILDGNGKKISNLKMTGAGNLSMFGTVSGTIKNIQFDKVNIAPLAPATAAGSNTSMAALAQTLSAGGVIESVRVSGSIIGGNNIGGLVVNHSGTMRYSSFDGVTAADYTEAAGYVGGLASTTSAGSFIIFSSSAGERQYLVLPGVTRVLAKYLGGLMGRSVSTGIVISSYSTADFYSEGASVYMGGIAGQLGNAAISTDEAAYTVFVNTYAAGNAFSRAVPLGTTATATSADTYFGGLFGSTARFNPYSRVTVHNSFADARSAEVTLNTDWPAETAKLTTLNLYAGGMFGSQNGVPTAAYAKTFSNNEMTSTTIDGSTVFSGADAEQLPALTIDFYKTTLGWEDFDLIWKISEGSEHPILQWE
jgi:hypothetical protein